MSKKVLVIAGSPRKNSYSTYLARRAASELESKGCDVEIVKLYDLKIKPCTACDACIGRGDKFCVHHDGMRDMYPKIIEAQAIILAFPIYWFNMNAQMRLFIDRLYAFHTTRTKLLKGKKIGVITTYGDVDRFTSGAINAIKSFEDMANYIEMEICGVVESTFVEVENREANAEVNGKISALVEAIL